MIDRALNLKNLFEKNVIDINKKTSLTEVFHKMLTQVGNPP